VVLASALTMLGCLGGGDTSDGGVDDSDGAPASSPADGSPADGSSPMDAMLGPDAGEPDGMAAPPAPPWTRNVEGRYLTALSTFIRPEQPLLFEATVRWSDGSGPTPPEGVERRLGFALQPLACPVGSAVEDWPKTSVGPRLGPYETTIDEAGRFRLDLGEVKIPAEANPITGRPLEGRLTLEGVASEGGPCGRVSGRLTAPISAELAPEENTFGSVRIGGLDDPSPFDRFTPASTCPGVE